MIAGLLGTLLALVFWLAFGWVILRELRAELADGADLDAASCDRHAAARAALRRCSDRRSDLR